MHINKARVRQERQRRAWSQEHLASVTGLGLRTVQRIESSGNGSGESASALASVFEVPLSEITNMDLPIAGSAPRRNFLIWMGIACVSILTVIVGRAVLAEPVELDVVIRPENSRNSFTSLTDAVRRPSALVGHCGYADPLNYKTAL